MLNRFKDGLSNVSRKASEFHIGLKPFVAPLTDQNCEEFIRERIAYGSNICAINNPATSYNRSVFDA